MKRAVVIVLVVVLVLVLGIWLKRRDRDEPPIGTSAIPTDVVLTSAATPAPPAGTPVLLGETILRGYADTNLPPENDLTLMSRLMDNALLLLKSAANQPLSANADWAALLRGNNAARERFLPDQHLALDVQGRLVDRWRTPLFFHALGGGRYELRSAGPDGILWTEDDLHRNADGSFRHGSNLNPASLVDVAFERTNR